MFQPALRVVESVVGVKLRVPLRERLLPVCRHVGMMFWDKVGRVDAAERARVRAAGRFEIARQWTLMHVI